MTKRKFFLQGTILTLISFFMRTTNIFYRSYLSGKIGPEGMGLYQLIFSVFMLAITLSTSGISLAVTRLVSSAIAAGRRNQIRSIVNRCLLFCLCLSLSISLIFLFCSDFAARVFLGNAQAASCLRILGVGLPFMSLCTCTKGYFLAVDEGVSSGVADMAEQLITIGSTVLIFTLMPFGSLEGACLAAMAASTVGEICSFVIDMVACRKSLHKNTPKERKKSQGVLHGMTHIALPCTFSSAARSLISTGENLLIPYQLQRGGFSYHNSMVQYGLLQGMAMPILYFPSSFLGSFASLLIPKITREREMGHKNGVAYIACRAVAASVTFGVITAAFFFAFGKELGTAFYNSPEAGLYIGILAPLIPLMYLDIVVDCLLKGLDEQLNSMKYNVIDSSLRVLLILLFMRVFGLQSYIAIIFFSTIFNGLLSIRKVVEVTKLRLTFLRQLFWQIPAAVLAVLVPFWLPITVDGVVPSLIYHLVVSYGIYGLIVLLMRKKQRV